MTSALRVMGKQCTKCKEVKDLDSFGNRSASKDGKRYQCKQCVSRRHKERYANDIEYRERIMERTRKRDIEKQFNISVEEYTEYMKNAECSICESKERLVLDHCHNSGKIRGVLCRTCNTGIGHLRDSPELVSRALYYLQET